LRSDRLGAAVIGAALMVALHVLTLGQAQAAVDGSTLALLFGMMALSAALEVSGAFALTGWWLTQRAHRPLSLLIAVSLASGVLSAFLINDVVCIAFTPLVLAVAEALDYDAKPYLLALATASNIGSVATITGNPQNILIGSLSGIPYARFAGALAPVAIVSLAANIAIVAFVHRAALRAPATNRTAPRPRRLLRPLAWKAAVAFAGVLAAFMAGASPAIAALVGASAILLTRSVKPRRFYAHIDWSLLALFAGLFVVVAGAERAGLAESLFRLLRPLRPGTVGGLTLLTAVLSNVVSNVPAVMALKSMIPHLPRPESAWLTLAMSSTLAGNLTLPGSMATVIVVERARGRCNITFVDFLKVGLPSAIVSLAIGAAWLAWRFPAH
jgi:Na+/H+ antiporter NhaD/arsenite permease-like protein